MLTVMTLAYRSISIRDLGSLDSIEIVRGHVFDTYVQQMFKRRRIDHLYSPEKTIHYLAYLARKTSIHPGRMFWSEQIDPAWLQPFEMLFWFISEAITRLAVCRREGFSPNTICGKMAAI
jgi:hypothetical protein